MKELNTLDFQDSIDNGISLVKFWAPWCGPCKSYAPAFEEFADKHEDVNCYSVNCDSEANLAEEFHVMSIPLTILFKDGEEI